MQLGVYGFYGPQSTVGSDDPTDVYGVDALVAILPSRHIHHRTIGGLVPIISTLFKHTYRELILFKMQPQLKLESMQKKQKLIKVCKSMTNSSKLYFSI